MAGQVEASETGVGHRIYHQGIGEDGKLITAKGVGGTSLTGKRAACENCHRRSGYGSSEGGMLAPPIIGKLLFKDRDFHYRELDRNMSRPITRPAYNQKLLARALKNGIAANDKPLQSLMPRYSLSRSEIEQLGLYLQQMGENDAIGVDKEYIHLASVITPDVPERRKKAMLATLETYVKNKNAETRQEHTRAVKSPWHRSWKYEAYRKWHLQVWELQGEPSSWKSQLENLYARQPVFALVSGIGTSTWQPVHEFCESNRVPCLFPSVALPGESLEQYYSFYYSQGIKLQARAIVKHLSDSHGKSTPQTILQIVDKNPRSTDSASVFSAQLATNSLLNRVSTQTLEITAANELMKMTGNDSSSKYVIVSWVPLSILEGLDRKYATRVDRIYAPTSSPETANYQHNFASDIYFIHPYTLPKMLDRTLVRATSWAEINRVSITDQEITANTYFAVTLLTKAVNHLRSNYSRNYMIERVEHMLDNNVFQSVFPHLSLGPNQRFASKGCYVLGPFKDPAQLNTAEDGKWIVP